MISSVNQHGIAKDLKEIQNLKFKCKTHHKLNENAFPTVHFYHMPRLFHWIELNWGTKTKKNCMKAQAKKCKIPIKYNFWILSEH